MNATAKGVRHVLTMYEFLTLIIALITAIGVVWAAYIAWKSYKNKRK